jgi:hypothetical protein
VAQQRRQAGDRVVERRPASGQRVAEADQVLVDRRPGLGIERLEQILELHRHACVGDRQGRPVGEHAASGSLVQIYVFEPEQRTGDDLGGGVDGDVAVGLVE